MMTRLPNNGMQLTALRAARNRRPHALSGRLVAKALSRIRPASEANRYAAPKRAMVKRVAQNMRTMEHVHKFVV